MMIGPFLALGSAMLFGISAPAAKLLVGTVDPWLLPDSCTSAPRASEGSLLLNLEGVLTALVAWVAVREHVHVRIVAGMVAIAAGALALAWDPVAGVALGWPSLLIVAACLAWAIDNNLTRVVSATDPLRIAALKGVVAGTVNVLIAIARGTAWPSTGIVLAAAVVGLLGYGVSLVLGPGR